MVENNNEVHKNVDDTRVLFQNIMTEIISCPLKTDDINPWKFDLNSEELPFSFLMEETLKCDQSGNVKNAQTKNLNQTDLTFMLNGEHPNEDDQNGIEFKPTFVSTPIKVLPKKSTSLNKTSYARRPFKIVDNKSGIRTNTKRKTAPKRIFLRDSRTQDSIKQRSMSSRLLDAINESCTTFIKSVKNVFTGNKNTNCSDKDTTNMNPTNNPLEESYCSYSFTNYMQNREAELIENKINQDISSEIMTSNTMDTITCKTCDDTVLLKHKFADDDQLKLTVKKLKLGINLYGCDFKRISKTMWPRETYMTPSVLYNLYRKLILK
ncbi:uncharacterized protein [Epargyreus clarus]|uniref:uncharacterized protein n=1 Tax=Epargyreus clarus TaxID=520877 RepID=UPI003C2BC788